MMINTSDANSKLFFEKLGASLSPGRAFIWQLMFSVALYSVAVCLIDNHEISNIKMSDVNAAGAIAMGLGGYLAARSDHEHYASEHQRESREIKEIPEEEAREVREVFRTYGLGDEEIAPILDAFQSRPKEWVNFMMRFELGLEEPEPGRAYRSAVTIGGAYVVGGLVPLVPYFFCHKTQSALMYSVFLTLAALAVFGFFKGRFSGNKPIRSSLQTMLIGGLAAAAAFGIASLFH